MTRTTRMVAVAAALALLTGCTANPTGPSEPTGGASASGTSSAQPARASSELADWAQALDDRDDYPARWVAVGDSIPEGMGASTVDSRWIDLTLDGLRERYPTDDVPGGVGYRPAAFAVAPPASTWARWATGNEGSVSASSRTADLGYRSVTLGAGATTTYPFTGTDLDLWWSSGGGTFSYVVDDGDAVDVDTRDSMATSGITSVSGLEAGAHTVTIHAHTPVDIEGLTAFDGDRDRGISLFDSSRSGATARTFTADLPGFLDSIAATKPDLVTITLGANDAFTRTPAEFEDDYRTLIDGLQSLDDPPSILLMGEFVPGTNLTQGLAADAGDYDAVVRRLADETGSAYVDLADALPDDGVVSLLSADGVHPNDAGQRVIADFVLEQLSVG
ncbi:SGNH/GDSL hydrolase family protein [Frigoribacterium sp. PhB24]|uniref:SGNH/GDSL hydrolase family protein n=1 Tax=Frigoribacterium sp. PhB24 TaxID=2485204 RepID=UPI000F45F629|nr:SGNH/GDSL hydrolase family protein [Frigoribacterium sp. PhB24]ROS51250.1 lysophospholipase L1-like esterase [Frigoribacterium sp. PhB24]